MTQVSLDSSLHFPEEKTLAEEKTRPAPDKEPIAIIGIGCRFPGGVNSPESFWHLLRNGVDAVSQIPPDRIDVDTYYHPQPATPGKIMTRWGGFLEDIDQFDAHFFGIAPREADRLDPQQRLLLEVTWEALADAGQTTHRLVGSQTGVFVGLWLNDYEARMFADTSNVDFYMTTGSGRYSASGRISYVLGLQGPSITVDTACSSSLVAVHLACQSLWSGQNSLAVAGGANVILQPHITIAYSQSKMMAPDGRCKFGDALADGYVRSEGSGMVVLKPLLQAVTDGDPIYAVIQGTAVNNDGRSGAYLATPSQEGQKEMLRLAYKNAGISPGQVQYVEAHGTGTKAGDPVEIAALGSVLATDRPNNQPCAVGSVKTNFGHTEGAAGVAGLIKVALALKHQAIPPSLHLQELNPNIPWNNLPLIIPRQLTPLSPELSPAVAGVSAFGIAGTNAHIVLQQAPQPVPTSNDNVQLSKPCLLPLSARTPEALLETAKVYKAFLSAKDVAALHNICYTAGSRRTHLDYRLALVANNHADLIKNLTAFIQDEDTPTMVSGYTDAAPNFKTVFVFPGQGSQWLGMGRQLLKEESVFRQTLTQCEAAMQPFVNWSLLEQLAANQDDPGYRLNEINVIQPTLLSIEIALATLWRSWGVEPDAVIGHSMGEVGAAYIAGALHLQDAMQIICRRSKLLRRTSGKGAMAVVELSIQEAEKAIAGYQDRLSIAVSNSPRSTVLSGDPATVNEIIKKLQSQDVFCRLIKVDVASHSPQMDPLKTDLLAALQNVKPRPASISIYSTVLGKVTDGADFDATYWAKNLRHPVLFSKMVQQLIADEHTIFIEMSPHPILLPAVQQGFQHANQAGTTLASLRRNEPEQSSLLYSLATLYTLGYPVDWGPQYPNGGQAVSLPLYPWQKERFWMDETKPGRKRWADPNRHPLLEKHLSSATETFYWETELNTQSLPFLQDHKVKENSVFPATAFLEMALAAATEAFGAGSHTLEEIVFNEALFLPNESGRTIQLIITPEMDGIATFEFYSKPSDKRALSDWLLHTTGKIRPAQADSTVDTLNAPEIPQDFQTGNHSISGEMHYQKMTERGLPYGPAFQGITQVWPFKDSVLGKVQLPETVSSKAHNYQTHPVLVDAAWQLLMTTMNNSDTDTYLPVSLDSFTLFTPPDFNQNLWGYAVRRPNATALWGDVYLLNQNQDVVALATGLQMRRLERDVESEIEDWLYEIQWRVQQTEIEALKKPDQQGSWLIFADTTGVGASLVSRLEALGENVIQLLPGHAYLKTDDNRYQINPADANTFTQLLSEVLTSSVAPLRGVVHLWSLSSTKRSGESVTSLETAQNQGSICVLHLIQALNKLRLKRPPRLWLVTRGSQAVEKNDKLAGVGQSLLWGLGGVIANEHPELHCVRVDLDPTDNLQEPALLWPLLWSDSPENQLALRKNQQFVARLARYPLQKETKSGNDISLSQQTAANNHPFQVKSTPPGVLDNLTLQTVPRQQPSPGEVEIEIYATGLNFMNVMSALGIYPGYPDGAGPLGIECAGKIVTVGDGVNDLRIGDEVVAIAFNSLGTHAVTNAHLVAPKPAHLSFEEAATIPVVFLTAHYALNYLGHLAAGEQVLIHSATGGVGMAAVQLAQQAKAEIFASAGTLEKQNMLRAMGIQHIFNSRSLAFANEIMDQTKGEGVDVILNSLAGEAISKGLSILKPYGRFLEIGKRDIYKNSRMGLLPFQNNLSYFAIDLDKMSRERPALIGKMLGEIMTKFKAGELKTIPCKIFPVSEVVEAFHYMAQAKHTGKIIISTKDPAAMVSHAQTRLNNINPNATYLITGGLGALGLSVAQWLAGQGANHLVLAGRRGPSANAQAAIDKIESTGTNVTVSQVDITDTESVTRLIAKIEQSLPPLRGIIHAAGLLNDGTLLQLDQEKFTQVVAPKMMGAWNLHSLTQNLPLDFFILFSSVSALTGSPGQGNYVAGNTFLDALAHLRRANNQPALTINWGPWSDIGMAATQINRGARLAQRGIGSLTPEQGIAALNRIMGQDTTQVAVMPFNVQQWAEFLPTAGSSPFYNELKKSHSATQPKAQTDNIRQALLAIEPGRRRQLLFEEHLREQTARVLRLEATRVPLNKPLKTLGLDSLMTLELRNRLENSLEITLSATFIFNYPTIAALTPYLAEKLQIPLTEPDVTEDDLVADAPLETEIPEELEGLDDLSKDEVETMLSEELDAIDDLLKGL